MTAAGLVVESSTATDVTGAGKIARNDMTGETVATVAGSTVGTAGGDVTVSAEDASVLTTEAGNLLYEPTTRLVTLASTEARNDLDRTVSATVESSQLDLGAGNLTVDAVSDGQLLAHTQALAVSVEPTKK